MKLRPRAIRGLFFLCAKGNNTMYYAENSDGSIRTKKSSLQKTLKECDDLGLQFIIKVKKDRNVYTLFMSRERLFASSVVGYSGLTNREITECHDYCQRNGKSWN